MNGTTWTKPGGASPPDPARFNPDREQRFAAFKPEPPKMKGSKRSSRPPEKPIGARKMLAEVLLARSGNEPKNIGKRIKIIEQTGKPDCNRFIHETAILILEHTLKTGDCTAAIQLIDALPAGVRRKRLALWFRDNSPICYSTKSGGVRLARPGEKAFRPIDLARAWRNRFE